MDPHPRPVPRQGGGQGGGERKLTTGPAPSPGSFRDSYSRVVVSPEGVRRTFSHEGGDWFRAAHRSGLLPDLVGRRLLHPYTIEDRPELVVSSEPIAVVTYPYEWSYTMLREAALLTLEVTQRAWDAGFHLRDASAFNVVFTNEGPRFVDLGSFRPGHTPFWFAYGQFGDHFLNPLVLAHSSAVEARWGWQQGLEGLTATDLRGLLGRRLFRRGLFSNVFLRATFEARNSSMSTDERRGLLSQAGLPPEAIAARFGRLADLIRGLDAPQRKGWDRYPHECSYTKEQTAAKAEFVEAHARRWPGQVAVDVGANTGDYAAILSRHFTTVVALEGDEAALDALYQRQQAGQLASNIRPVLADILDPSGGRGVLGHERPALLDRLHKASLFSWLAVLHHLVVSSNLPPALFAQMAESLAPHHIVEYVSPDDPMAQLLAAGRPEPPWPFDPVTFEREVTSRFRIVDQLDVSATRRLYALTRL